METSMEDIIYIADELAITQKTKAEKNKARQTKYRLANPDRIKETQKRFRDRTSANRLNMLTQEIRQLAYENHHLRNVLTLEFGYKFDGAP